MKKTIKLLLVGIFLILSTTHLFAGGTETFGGGSTYEITLQEAKLQTITYIKNIDQKAFTNLDIQERSKEIFLSNYNAYLRKASEMEFMIIEPSLGDAPLIVERNGKLTRVEAYYDANIQKLKIDKDLTKDFEIQRLTKLLIHEVGHMVGFGFNCEDNLDEIAAGVISTPPVVKENIILDAGQAHSCVLHKGEIKCWGYNQYNQLNVPNLPNATKLSVGGFHSCAFFDGKPKCWGLERFGALDIPLLNNPREVLAGGYHTCALDDDGVKCWGFDDDGRTKVPPLTNPRKIYVGYYHSCALDDNGLKCWGSNRFKQLDVPQLHNPRDVTIGFHHMCALTEDNNVTACWGSNERNQLDMPVLHNPTQISAGGLHTCALDDDGVKCWGFDKPGYVNLSDPATIGNIERNRMINKIVDIPKSVIKPTRVSAGSKHTCVLDGDRIICWGDNEFSQLENIPSIR